MTSERQTDRTERMLEEALRASEAGDRVIVLCENAQHAHDLHVRYRRIMFSGHPVSRATFGSVEDVEEARKKAGAPLRVFVDPPAFEAKVRALDESTIALLAIEWNVQLYDGTEDCCPRCKVSLHDEEPHDDCVVDRALTAANLVTQEHRDLARRILREAGRL